MAEEGAGYCQMTLDAKLASKAAPELFERLREHRADTLVLDASGVEQIGALSMQIIAAAAKTWQDAGQSFEVIDPSEAFIESARNFGIDTALLGLESFGREKDDA
ncbi:MAG: STAS domain-containing protein [Parvularcula sp.]|jgi:chemotaxis protein CheX|nr:STAS domain-containing protein [Parvularcula sp.]